MALILFDLDHTLLEGDCDQLWGDFLSAKQLVMPHIYQQQKDRFYQDYLAGCLNMQEFLAFCAQVLTRFSTQELKVLGDEFANDWLRPRLRPKALATIDQHLAENDTLVIITATNQYLGSLAARLLNIEHLIASRLEQQDGRYTGRAIGEPCYREGKVIRLKQWLQQHPFDLSKATFYSDSHNDLPLLKLVARPIAVTPDTTLEQYAIQHKWTIFDWSL